MNKGIVKFINRDKSFGFIEDEKNEYFFSLNNQSLSELDIADEVHFEATEDDKGRKRGIKVRQIFRDQLGRSYVKNWRSGWVHFNPANLLPYIYEDIRLKENEFTIQQFDFDEVVGTSELVSANEDEVFYAIREGRKGHSRLVKGKDPVESKSIVLTLKPYYDETIEIVSGYIGIITHPEPYSTKADKDSIEFWKQHALRAEAFVFDQESVTNQCPW